MALTKISRLKEARLFEIPNSKNIIVACTLLLLISLFLLQIEIRAITNPSKVHEVPQYASCLIEDNQNHDLVPD